MAKFYGAVGYAEDYEGAGDEEGIWKNRIVERNYYGDVLRNTRRWENGQSIHDDLQINNQISIVADAYAWEHFFAMKYVRWMGTLWKVTNVEVQRPRLLLTIGDVWHGEKKN